MRNEARIIGILQNEPSNQSKHLPVLLDQFRTTDRRSGLILKCFNGYDLYSVREEYKDGVDQKHMVWMLNRLLSVLGYAHSKGIIHGNIEPAHLMIRPSDHNLCLIDWSYGIVDPSATGDGFKVFNKDFSAPEVKERKPPIPSSDLYSVGKCMIYALGGNIKTNTMPDSVNKDLQRFIQFFIRESPIQRAQDAWEMQNQLVELIEYLWGPRKFLEFRM
jgi:serine/threonine protein kinase